MESITIDKKILQEILDTLNNLYPIVAGRAMNLANASEGKAAKIWNEYAHEFLDTIYKIKRVLEDEWYNSRFLYFSDCVSLFLWFFRIYYLVVLKGKIMNNFTISSLVEILERLKKQHGDLPVTVNNMCYEYPIEQIEIFNKDSDRDYDRVSLLVYWR